MTKAATLSADTATASGPDAGGQTGEPGPGAAANKPRRRSIPAALRAAAAPALAGALALTGLCVWTATGGAGTLARVRLTVTGAMIPESGDSDLAAYLTIANTGAHDDELLSVTTDAAGQTMLAGNAETPGSGSGTMTRLPGIAVPAHATVALGPYGRDIMLVRPASLTLGQQVELTLHFRAAGAVQVRATVVPIGTAPR